MSLWRNYAVLQAHHSPQRCVQGRRRRRREAAGGGVRGAGGRMRHVPVLGAAAALGSVPALGEHPGGAGRGAGVRVPPLRRAGGQTGPVAEARRRAAQQAPAKR